MPDYISLTELWGEPFDYIIDNCGSSVAQGFVDRVNRIKSGEMTIELRNPPAESDWDTITDVDFDNTDKIWFYTKHGKQVEFIKVKPVTSNADRIRGMSDEELADFIGGIFTVEHDVWGDYDPRLVVTQEPRVEVRNKEDMMDWLQSPAEGGDAP